MSKITASALELIGGTPLLKADRYADKAGVKDATILTKLEYLNPEDLSKTVSIWQCSKMERRKVS